MAKLKLLSDLQTFDLERASCLKELQSSRSSIVLGTVDRITDLYRGSKPIYIYIIQSILYLCIIIVIVIIILRITKLP